MEKILTILFLTFALTIEAQVHVKGYYRSNGTYVQPHYRSSPDGNPYNNWSYPGNTNPYTGKTATGNPDTYLKNYYKNSNSTTTDVWIEGYYKSDGTYVPGHYRSAPDGNPYNNWSYPGNTNPYTGKTATGNPDTYLKNYYNNSSSTSSYNSSNYNYSSYFYVTANSLNVRSGPSTNYSVLTTLSYGESVQVIGTENSSWIKVKVSYIDPNSFTYKTTTGYVSSAYLSSTNPLYSNYKTDNIDYDKLLKQYSNSSYSYPNNTYSYNSTSNTSYHPYGYNKGQITLWTDCSDDGQISVYIDGTYAGKITSFFYNGYEPNCGDDGTLVIIKSPGTYNIYAYGNSKKWEGYITVTADKCQIQKLSK